MSQNDLPLPPSITVKRSADPAAVTTGSIGGVTIIASSDQGHADTDVPHPAVRCTTMHSPVRTNCVILGLRPQRAGHMSLSHQQKVEVLSPHNAIALDTLAGVRGEMAQALSAWD